MTYGYWFWFGVLCVAGALILLLLTARRKPRPVRTVHAVVLFALLAFGGFKCAHDERQRAELLANAPPVYTIGVTKGDEGGMKFKGDGKRVEAVEYTYSLGGKEYAGLALLDGVYTIERDFYPQDIAGKCVIVQAVSGRPEISRVAAVMKFCPETAPANGWSALPSEVFDMIDALWLKDR